jgi:hypothetical protein
VLKIQGKSYKFNNSNQFDLGDSKVVHELALLASNITRDVCDVLESFLSFQGIYEEKKVHNMLSMMLDLRVKNFL